MVEEEQKIKEDYYAGNSGRKVADFCLGFFGVLILNLVVLAFSSIIRFSGSIIGIGVFFSVIYQILSLIFFIAIIIFCVRMFKIGRRYIAIGIICLVVVVPLLFLGACFIILAGM